MPGLARPADRSSSALAADRSLAACAVARSPCTVTGRTRVRPLTESGLNATRTSHTPGAAVAATRYLERIPCLTVRTCQEAPRGRDAAP